VCTFYNFLRIKPYIFQAKRIPASALAEAEDDDGAYVSDEDESAEMEVDSVKADPKKKAEKLKLAKQLSDLVIICQSVSFKGFEYAKTSRKIHFPFLTVSVFVYSRELQADVIVQ
jgi:hypothetical protein